MSNSDSSLFLHNLPDKVLQDILNMSGEDKIMYFTNLIKRFYPDVESAEEFEGLIKAYNASFALEYVFRQDEEIADSFTCVYTKTGLVRELSNDLYFMIAEYKYQIN